MLNPEPHLAARSQFAEAEELKQWLRDYCGTRVDLQMADERRSLPPNLVLDFGNKGLLGMLVPIEDGGLELSHQAFCAVLEQLGAIDSTLCLFVGLSNVLGIRPLQKYATQELRDLYLEKLATGRILGSFALTEPAAGSNPLAMTTSAHWTGDGYIIDGTKHWIGNATWCGVIYVFARTFDETGKFAGITGFAVDREAPGLSVGAEARTMGMKATVQARVELKGVWVSPNRILGGIGRGLEVAQDTMMRGRLVIAAAAAGAMKRCALVASRYAIRRNIATGRLYDHPVTRAVITDLAARIEGVDALVASLLSGIDRGQVPPPAVSAACKIAATEFLSETVDDTIQILGGRGYIETNYIPQVYRDARILRIFEGPTETLTAFIGSIAFKTPDEIRSYLIATHGQAEAFDEALDALGDVRRAVNERTSGLSTIDQRLLLRDFAGRLVTLAIVSSACAKDSGAQQFIRRRYLALLSGIEGRLAAAATSTDALDDMLRRYRTQIGEFESRVTGEDIQVDPLLRNEWNST